MITAESKGRTFLMGVGAGIAVKISVLPLWNEARRGKKKDEEKKDLGKGGAERKKGSKLHLDQMLLRMSNTEE